MHIDQLVAVQSIVLYPSGAIPSKSGICWSECSAYLRFLARSSTLFLPMLRAWSQASRNRVDRRVHAAPWGWGACVDGTLFPAFDSIHGRYCRTPRDVRIPRC